MTKNIVWIIGSNSSGKTTQSKLIHKNCNGNGDKTITPLPFINSKFEEDLTYYTIYQKTAHVGKVEDTQCTGTDSLNTKDKIEMAYLCLIDENVETIVIDGILATGTWCDMIHQVRPEYDIKTNIILLNFDSPEANFKRLRQRRANKSGLDVKDIILEEKTQENVANKLKTFRSIFERTKSQFNVSLEINADLSESQIHNLIVQKTGI